MSEPGAMQVTPGSDRRFQPDRARFDAQSEIRRARRRQDLKDLTDLALLIGVNLLFLFWEAAQIPFVGRDISMALLLTLNAFYVGSWFIARVVPSIRARSIASSWSPDERGRVQL